MGRIEHPKTDGSADPARRGFMIAGLAALSTSLAPSALAQAVDKDRIIGPILGHCDHDSVMVWMRATGEGEYGLEVVEENGSAAFRATCRTTVEEDLCLRWRVHGLLPGRKYRYRILKGEEPVAEASDQVFTTGPKPGEPAKVRFAMSSCAKEDAGSRAVWQRMAAEKVDAVLLLGDTPYIDSTALEKQSRRHREFASVSEYQDLLRSRPCWWTWDDHDFAGNDTSGLVAGKENSRLVFTRYRPQPAYGDGTEGIYTRFRRGALEVFLLDTRWFSMTEPSFADPEKPSLLGKKQWEWLQDALRDSTATFKLLACGMIWDDKTNAETDDWGTFPHERKAIENFIVENRISGVILLGGDIHASRVLRYPTKEKMGYDLVQFIASPIHASTIPKLNVAHPDLIRSAVEPNVFLRVDVDDTVSPARFDAVLVNKDGEQVFSHHLRADQLQASAS